jgi:trans-aconitate 2-methyltransferase
VNEKSIFWDANTYDNISNIQENWANIIIQKRKWTGKENLLDAGCGSGRVTKILAKKITEGNIYAIDSDPNMIEKAKETLKDFKNVKVMHADLLDIQSLDIHIKFEVIFSNAVLHWVLDHRKVFENFYDLLNPEGQLLIQCGGYGNLQKTLSIFDAVNDLPEYSKYFSEWRFDRNYAKPKEIEKILKEIGNKDVEVYLTEASAVFNSKKDYFVYLKTVDLRLYLKYLSSEQLQNEFVDNVSSIMEKHHMLIFVGNRLYTFNYFSFKIIHNTFFQGLFIYLKDLVIF